MRRLFRRLLAVFFPRYRRCLGCGAPLRLPPLAYPLCPRCRAAFDAESRVW